MFELMLLTNAEPSAPKCWMGDACSLQNIASPESPTPNLLVPCWSPDQQVGQGDLGARPKFFH